MMSLFSFAGIDDKDKPKEKTAKNPPVFSNVVYQGDDQIYKNNPLKPDEFYSPILQGCYPDPAITRKGDDYYMVCSSFAMFPGVPIFHSKDLVNWTDLGGVLNNVSEFNPHDTGISQGVYAPGITYNPHNDTFYMIVTAFSGDIGNIIVKTKDPMKGWGSPIKLILTESILVSFLMITEKDISFIMMLPIKEKNYIKDIVLLKFGNMILQKIK